MPVIKKFKANLRAKYSRYIKLSIIFTLALIIAAFKFSPHGEQIDGITILPQDMIKVEDIVNTIQKQKPLKAFMSIMMDIMRVLVKHLESITKMSRKSRN